MAKYRFSIPGDYVNQVKHHDKDAEFTGGFTVFEVKDEIDDGVHIDVGNVSLEEVLALIDEFNDPNELVELGRQEEQETKNANAR